MIPPPVQPGEPVRARTINDILGAIDELRRVSTGPGLRASWGEAGLWIGLALAPWVDPCTIVAVHATGEHPDVPGAFLPSAVAYDIVSERGYTIENRTPDWRVVRGDEAWIRPGRVQSRALVLRYQDVEGVTRAVVVCPDEVLAIAPCPEPPPGEAAGGEGAQPPLTAHEIAAFLRLDPAGVREELSRRSRA